MNWIDDWDRSLQAIVPKYEWIFGITLDEKISINAKKTQQIAARLLTNPVLRGRDTIFRLCSNAYVLSLGGKSVLPVLCHQSEAVPPPESVDEEGQQTFLLKEIKQRSVRINC